MISQRAEIISNKRIGPAYFNLVLAAPEAAKIAQPGQFLMLRATGDGPGYDPFLGRPMSLNAIDGAEGLLGVVYQVVGRGTELLSRLKAGEGLVFSGPWGRGWQTTEKIKKAALVGGGAGIAPLLPLAQRLQKQGARLDIFLGAARQDGLIDEDELALLGEVKIATDDGSRGQKALVHQLLPDQAAYDMVFCCGPRQMMSEVARWAKKSNLPCQVSLEERMGCGFGVCAGCVCGTKSAAGETAYKRVCREGPVFFAEEVFYND